MQSDFTDPNRPEVTVIMINRNGGEYLRRALGSLRDALSSTLRVRRDFEFLLVDNGSTDESVSIAEEQLSPAEFAWRIVDEPEAGVNAARLAGLRESRGRYLVYTDNDLIFGRSWLTAYFEAFERYADCRVFAGRVKVGEVEGDPPAWLDLTGAYSRPSIVVRCENGDRNLTASLADHRFEGPVGPNMAFERSIFEDYGPFDRNFGLRPGSMIAGAEAEFFRRLRKNEEPFAYAARACVYHPLKKHQISKTYFRHRLCGVGRVLARIQRQEGRRSAEVCGIKRYLFRQLASAWLDYGKRLFHACPKERFFYRTNISIVWGQILEDYSARHQQDQRTVSPEHTVFESVR